MKKVPPDKSSRVDRADKLSERKNKRETVVKCCLKDFINGTDDQKNKIVSAIKQRVEVYSKRVHLASLALCGYVKEKFHDIENVCDVDIEEIFDVTFFRQMMLGLKDSVKQFDNLPEFFEIYPEYILNVERHLGDRNIYSAGAISYITNLKNSLRFNLTKRIKTFLKHFQEKESLSDEQRVYMLYKIHGWSYQPKDSNMIESPIVFYEISKHRNILCLQENQYISDVWSNSPNCLISILRYFIHLNRFYETNQLPTFNIVPITKIRSHFITIDTSVFYGILREAGLTTASAKTFSDNDISEGQWHSIFKISKLQGATNTFTKTINTDGIAVCCHFERPKVNKETKTEPEKYRVVAVDPGRVNIFYGVERLENGSVKEYVLTRRQYYHDTGISKANEKSKQWNLKIKDDLEKLSKVSTKGVSVTSHQQYMKTYQTIKDSLWLEYLKAKWARQRFQVYSGKKKLYSTFFNKIKYFNKEYKVKIAYGSAKFDSTGPGELAVPTTSIFKECSTRFETFLVDEYLTTKIDCETDTVLEKVKVKGANNCLRGLLWCSNNSKFISRDKNAALNILRCAILPTRPTSLLRGQPRVEQIVGKRIKDVRQKMHRSLESSKEDERGNSVARVVE